MNTEKRPMRDAMKRALAALTPQERERDAIDAAARLTSLVAYTNADAVLAYAATPDELSLDPFIAAALAAGKRVCVPRVEWDTMRMTPARIENLDADLVAGRYDIRVPSPRCAAVDPSDIALVCVPALAFDLRAQRLGRGAGFYDRWIQRRRNDPAPCVFVGAGHDAQIVERVPTDPHDQPLDLVVTPTRTLTCPERSTEP